MAPIFNGLQPSKLTAHPCAGRSRSKSGVFQPAAGLIWLASLLLTLATALPATARDYRVELLVFENLNVGNPSGERFGTDLQDAVHVYGDNIDEDESLLEAEPVEIGTFPVVATADLSLSSVYEKLLSARDYAPVMLTGWVMPGVQRTESEAAAIAGSRGSRVVTGLVWFSIDTFLRLRLEIEFASGGEAIQLTRTQTRLRSRQLYYFDHPRFGAVATVTPL